MQSYLLCYDISKDGTERVSQITSGTMTLEALGKEDALTQARASLAIQFPGQTILDVWVPDTTPHELSHLYPIEQYGHWGEEHSE